MEINQSKKSLNVETKMGKVGEWTKKGRERCFFGMTFGGRRKEERIKEGKERPLVERRESGLLFERHCTYGSLT